jgi:hypothetical protein
MPQEASDINGRHVFLDIKVGQTVPFMAQATIVEIAIEREKSGSIQLVQERNYFFVFHALPAQIVTDLADGDTPTPQQSSLTLRYVFIQDVHAGRDS